MIDVDEAVGSYRGAARRGLPFRAAGSARRPGPIFLRRAGAAGGCGG